LFFRVVAHNADFFLRCGPQRKKMIDVAAYTADIWSALKATTRKNV
jgi:hypothetical protein